MSRITCFCDALQFVAALLLIVVSALYAGAQEWIRVRRVVDGDTIILESGERVRLLGVNTAETKHPQRKLEAFGKAASDYTKRMVEGKLLRLELDRLARSATNGLGRCLMCS